MLNHEVMWRFGTCSMNFTPNFFSVHISANLTAFLNSLPPKTYKWTSWSKKLIKNNILSPKLLCALAPLVEKMQIFESRYLKNEKGIKKIPTDIRLVLKTLQNIKHDQISKGRGVHHLLNYNGMTHLTCDTVLPQLPSTVL